MGLLQLPTELLEAILQQAFVVRGTRRGLRLRLVNKTFERAVAQVLYIFRLIDDWFDVSYRINPNTLIMPYLAYRVANEPADGKPLLRCLRRVALVLQEDTIESDGDRSTFEAHILQILPPFQRKLREILDCDKEISEAEFEKHLFAAAIRVNNLTVVQAILTRNAGLFKSLIDLACENNIYGCYDSLAGFYAGKEMMEYLMTFQTQSVHYYLRQKFFLGAARTGRADVLRFVYNFKKDEQPWHLAGDPGRQIESRVLYRAQNTHSVEVLKFIVELREIYPIWSKSADLGEYSLDMCVQMGCLNTVKYALKLGAHPRGELGFCFGMGRPRSNVPVLHACERGYIDIVECLLAHGADSERTMAKAADWGHLELVRRLLDMGTDSTEALSKAAFGGYLDLVRLLLDSGVDVNESIRLKAPLAGAISKEHTVMFDLLIERGAGIHADGVARECVRRAKKDGLDSMLQLLQAHGIDTESFIFEDDQLTSQW